jgi:outer membrane protein OmpA-like peptidoglycan-associated protein
MFNKTSLRPMKRLFLMMLMVVAYAAAADAQGFLKRLKDRALNAAENAVTNKVDSKVTRETDEAMDDVLDGNKKSKSNDADYEDEEVTDQQNEAVDFAQIQAKSDFKRGGTVFFNDDLSGEQMGEFPSKWDLLNGSECEVVSIKGKKAIKIEGTQIRPLMKDLKYLPEEFTIEFDVLSQPAQEGSGWDATLDIFFFGEDYDGNGEDRVFDYRTSVETSNVNNNQKGEYDAIAWGWGSWNPNGNKIDGETSRESIRKVFKKNDWNHIAFSFNKRAFKAYLNYSRIVNIPNQKQPRAWSMEGSSDSNKGVYITNIVMAKGAVDLYERNTTDYSSAVEKAIAETGMFVTNNILFETGKATLKPESMAEIQKVADYMKKNPSARFEVQGHTDNQGSDAVNDPLSQQRAEAVVKALEGLGCDPFNMRAVGKGSHEPVADNKTDAGRAQNRRVVFVKK